MSTRLSRGQFGRGIEGPAQLVVDGEGVIFVRKAQILRSFVPYREEIELSSPAQYLHFLAGQRCFNAAGETGANGEELVFPVQLEAGRDGGCEKLLAQPLKTQRPVSLVRQCPLLVAATAALLRVVESLFGARDVGGHGGAQLRRRRVVLVVGKVLSRANKSCFLKAHRRRRFNGKSITAKSILPLTIPLE